MGKYFLNKNHELTNQYKASKQKKPLRVIEEAFYIMLKLMLLHGRHHFVKLSLFVSCIILMNDISFGQLVKQTTNLLVKLLSFTFLRRISKFFNESSSSFQIVLISKSFGFVRSDSL